MNAEQMLEKPKNECSMQANVSSAPHRSKTLVAIVRNSTDSLKFEVDAKNELTLDQLCNNDPMFDKRTSHLSAQESMLDLLKRHLLASNAPGTSAPSPQTVNSYQPSSINLYKCSDCNLMFVDKRLMIEHQNLACQDFAANLFSEFADCTTVGTNDLFRCSFCTHSFTNKSFFMSHILRCAALNSF